MATSKVEWCPLCGRHARLGIRVCRRCEKSLNKLTAPFRTAAQKRAAADGAATFFAIYGQDVVDIAIWASKRALKKGLADGYDHALADANVGDPRKRFRAKQTKPKKRAARCSAGHCH